MNILTHPVHTGYQFDLAATGHEFYSLALPGSDEVFWDHNSRPKPKNYHQLLTLNEAPVRFDLALIHYDLGYQRLRHEKLPMIFKEHCLRAPFNVPTEWLNSITYYCFSSQIAAERWIVPPEYASRKVVIGMGMNLEIYGGYSGNGGDVLVVGQHIPARGNEKGYENLMRLASKFRITVVGRENQGIPGAVGPAGDYGQLLQLYRTHRVFLNPSHLLGMSTLEAMATGLPVVSFSMLNSDIIQSGFNGFLVNDIEEAGVVLKRLLEDGNLARRIGRNARSTVKERFRHDLFQQRWNALFRKAVFEYHSVAVDLPSNSVTDEAAGSAIACDRPIEHAGRTLAQTQI
jgi:glycosyltransferase involved in cell wall biosynthesis